MSRPITDLLTEARVMGIFNSCTTLELRTPQLITGTRLARIARGAGVPRGIVRQLIKATVSDREATRRFRAMADARDEARRAQENHGFGAVHPQFEKAARERARRPRPNPSQGP